MNNLFIRFLARWSVSSLGLWIAAGLLGQRITYGNRFGVLVIAGLILALVNMIIKPIVVILSLPALLFTLGFFMLVINGLMLLLVSKVYPSLYVKNFGTAMVAGIIIGLVNYLVSRVLEAE